MLDSVRKFTAVPQVPVKALTALCTVSSFAWFLTNDLIHPLFVYVLQLYLAF